MKYIKNHISKSTPKNRRPCISMTPEYITIHSTGNPKSTARNERDWLTNPSNNRTASFHIVVDEKEAIECIPLNESAWHAGDGRNGTGNRKSIGIEICESGDRVKTIQNTVELVAQMLFERNWDIDKLRRHFDWSGKNCPRILNYNNWEGWTNFKVDVQKELNKIIRGENMYRIRKSWKDNKSQKGAFSNLDNAIEECKKHDGYKIYDDNGNQVYPKQNKETNHWAYKYWKNFNDSGIEINEMRFDDNITRGEAIALLYRALNSK